MLTKTEADWLYLFGANVRAKRRASAKRVQEPVINLPTSDGMGSGEEFSPSSSGCYVDSIGNYGFKEMVK